MLQSKSDITNQSAAKVTDISSSLLKDRHKHRLLHPRLRTKWISISFGKKYFTKLLFEAENDKFSIDKIFLDAKIIYKVKKNVRLLLKKIKYKPVIFLFSFNLDLQFICKIFNSIRKNKLLLGENNFFLLL